MRRWVFVLMLGFFLVAQAGAAVITVDSVRTTLPHRSPDGYYFAAPDENHTVTVYFTVADTNVEDSSAINLSQKDCSGGTSLVGTADISNLAPGAHFTTFSVTEPNCPFDTLWDTLKVEVTHHSDTVNYSESTLVVLVRESPLRVDTVYSSLPNVEEEDSNIDYHANMSQTHQVFVRVVASADVPADRDTVYLFNRDCLGAYGLAGQYVLPAMSADETLLVTFDITEPNCASDLMDSLRVIVSGYDAPSYGTGDTLVVSVEKPGSLVVDNVVAVADTEFAGYNEPFFTMGQQFYLAVVLRNAGSGRVDDINVRLSSSSVYGCSSYFDTLTAFDTSLSGGDTCVLLIPIVADTINHGGTGTTDDEIFQVTVSGTDANNLGDCGVGYTDDDDSIGIVMPPSLHLIGVDGYGPAYTGEVNDWGNPIPWMNFWDPAELVFYIYSDTGDYAVVDSIADYTSFVDLFKDGAVVPGISGNESPSAVLDPTLTTSVDAIAPGDTVVYRFDMSDYSVPPEYQGFVSARFYADFHDADRADAAFASTSPFDTILAETSYIMAIDVTVPEVGFVEPYSSADPWPSDDTVLVWADDDVSGVDEVYMLIEDVSGNYWNGTSWDTVMTTFEFEPYSGDTFYCVIPEPAGGSSYRMTLWAQDSAQNLSDRKILPRGEVAYLHIYDVVSDLPREMVSGERWQADWYHQHTVTVHIYNEYSQPMTNVVIALRSSDPNTEIGAHGHWEYRMDTVVVDTINAGEHQFIQFDVIEPGYDVVDDTLTAFVYNADPTSDGRVVGEHYTDDNAYVNVEKPAQLFVYEVWNDAPLQVEDTGYVTYDVGGDSENPQHFNVYIKVCYTGEDTVEYLRMVLRQNPAGYLTALGDTVFEIAQADFVEHIVDPSLGDLYCYTLVTEYQADSNECLDRAAEVLFEAKIDSFDFDNWDPFTSSAYISQINSIDSQTYAAVLEPPRVDIVDADVSGGYLNYGQLWINRADSITFTVAIYSPLSSCSDSDRATAKFAGERTPLVMFDTLGAAITGVNGLTAPVGLDDTLFPGAADTISYTVFWDGTTDINTIVSSVIDTLWFKNNYWDVYPQPWLVVDYDTLGDTIYIQPEMDTISNYLSYSIGIDVVNPVVTITEPSEDMYSPWTWETDAMFEATDNFSGIDTLTTQIQIEDPAGNYWNGTGWQIDEIWLDAANVSGDVYGVPMPATTDLIYDGIYTVRAKCYDVAGNFSGVVQKQFIFDSTSPLTQIYEPDDGDTAAFFHCDFYDTIWALAWDTVVISDPAAVSGVHQAYIAIEDTLINRWWDGNIGTWVTSMAAIYNPMTHESGDTWYYTGITPPGDFWVYRVYTYADDNVDNFDSPTDSTVLVNDCRAPEIVLTDTTYDSLITDYVFSSDTLFSNYWDSVMTCNWGTENKSGIYGYVTDSIVSVDSVKLAICKDDTLWWDDTLGEFVSGGPIWFYPDEIDTVDSLFHNTVDSAEISPGVTVRGSHKVWFRYEWGAYEPGCYYVYALAWDDMTNQSDTAVWNFAVDNMDPDYMAAYQPYYGQICTLYAWESEFHETLSVGVYDTTLGCLGWFNNIDSAQIALSTVIGGEVRWWNGSTWDDDFGWLDLTPGDSIYDPVAGTMIYLWNLWLPVTALQNGTYNAEVQAWTQTGRYIHFYYNFVITGGLGYLTVNVIDPTPIFVGDSVRIEVAAHHTSGAIDTTFYYPVDLSSNYPDPSCLDLPSGSIYLERGCDTLWIHPTCPGKGIIIWANSDASGYDPGNTFPFDVISSLDPEMFSELRDLAPDQGNQIMIVHTRSTKDPLYTGEDIDTLTLKVTDYVYQVWDGSAWTDIVPDSITEFAGTLYVYYTPGTFDPRTYRIEVNYRTNLDPATDFDTLAYVDLGSIAPHDDIAPAAVADLRIAQVSGQVHLWWDEVTTGYDGSPEIDPEDNIRYVIYRSVDNPYDLDTYEAIDTVDVPEYYDALPVDPIATPTYYYVVAVDHDYNNSDISERVGRASYEFGAGWSQIAVPFDLDEYEPLTGSELAAYLGDAGVTNISRWDNTISGWSGVYVPPVVNEEIDEGADVLVAYGSADVTLSIAGDLPETTPTYDYLAGRWNSVMVPLNRPDIRMASDLINAIGTGNCSAIAHRSPYTGWTMCVWTGTEFYGEFSVYPGQGYLMWAETDGSWPGTKSSIPAEHRHSEYHPTDCGSVPKALYGDIEGGAENVRFVVTDKAGHILMTEKDGFWFHDGKFLIPVGNIDWAEGQEIIVRFYSGDEVSDEAVIVLDNSPAQYAGKFFLRGDASVPTAFALRGANPNPFNASTEISFDLPVESRVKLAVYDVSGREIAKLVDGELPAGTYKIRWDACDGNGDAVPTGVYFCKMKAGEFVAITRLVLVK